MTDTADRLDERNALVGELAEILAVRAEPIVLLDRIVDWHRDRLARLRADIASDTATLAKLAEHAEQEIADAKAGEEYAAEVNNGGALMAEHARRFAWETVARIAGGQA